MRQIHVETVIGRDQENKPITKTVLENIYTIEELPMLGKLLSCKDSKKRQVNYLNIPCAFDIETTNIYEKDSEGNIITEPRPYAFMYQWQFCLDDCVCFGRTWEEFQYLIKQLEARMNLSYKNRLVVYVHNLPFEWNFMYRFINYQEGFFKEERKPLKILTKEGIEFRCSYALSNMTLAKFCENEENVTHYKLVDTYDYDKIRTFRTTLTEEEEAYCYNDVRGLCECIKSRLKHDTLSTIPMTSTGYVRRDMRASVKGDKKYRQLFRNNALDADLYQMCRDAFRGGDTHANVNCSNQLLTGGVTSKDEASAYPATMIMDLFPQTAFFKVNVSTFLNRDMSGYALLMEVRFINLEYVGKCGIPYISLAKCKHFSVDKVVDNGRILKASFVEAVLTDIDYEIITHTENGENIEYKYDDIFIKDIYASAYAPLSDKIKNVVMDYYRAKTLLKGDKDRVYEYNKKKNALNSCFGCMVMRIDQTEVGYDAVNNKYIIEAPNMEETLSKFYKSRNNFLSYQHGVWITAHARMRLRQMLWKVGKDVCYCDTDSIKYRHNHDDIFRERNAEIIKEAEKAGAYAETLDGKIKYLGVWEDDGYYEEFKTLGAKKYVTKENGEIVSTIAGVSKKAGQKYFDTYGLEAFEIGNVIADSGHLTAFYNDDEVHTITIKGDTFTTGSNIAIINNKYTIKVQKDYLTLIQNALANKADLDYI